MTSFDYRGNPISEQMTPVERAATEDVMSELTYTPGPGTGTNHNNPTQATPGALTLADIEEAAQRAELCASVEWPGEFARQILFLALQMFPPTDDDAWRKRGVEIRDLRATITQQAQELAEANAHIHEQQVAYLDASNTIEFVKQQLAASRARCSDLEVRLNGEEMENDKAGELIAQLQATLTAREARIRELEDQMNAKRYFTNEAL